MDLHMLEGSLNPKPFGVWAGMQLALSSPSKRFRTTSQDGTNVEESR